MNIKVDLHMHSTASDGKLSPTELVDWAIKKGMKGIAITDHEVVGGSKEAVLYAKNKGIEIIPGVEIGTDEEELELYDVHIVGLFLDLENERLVELSKKLMEAREVQKKEMIEKLNGLGYDVTFDELKKEAGGINYGRPHLARILMRRYDEFEKIGDVFDKLLGYKGKASVRQWKESMKKTIEIIHGAGGIAILAHPMLYDDFDKVIDRFVECGGDGIEVDYYYGNRQVDDGEVEGMISRARDIAKGKGLVISGGGDFHSFDGGFEIGDYGVSDSEFEKLKKYWMERSAKVVL